MQESGLWPQDVSMKTVSLFIIFVVVVVVYLLHFACIDVFNKLKCYSW